jgi:hypothetical protein
MLLGRRGGKTNSSLAIIRYSYIPGDAAWCSGLQLAAEISIKKLMEQIRRLLAGWSKTSVPGEVLWLRAC